MKYIITVVIALNLTISSFSQEWHNANDTLKSKQTTFHTLIRWVKNNRYDTVNCIIQLQTGRIINGFKVVFIKDGYYIDDDKCFRLFLDSYKNIIEGVKRYRFM